MRVYKAVLSMAILTAFAMALGGCATMGGSSASYESRLPPQLDTNGRKTVLIDPKEHVWGAYDSDGSLIRAGLATAGGSWCPDIHRSCKTPSGTYHINYMRGDECRSSKYPKPHGGGLMPYCMYFNKGMALHGAPPGTVVEDNISHGCVRMTIPDAYWMYSNFADVGTKVIVRPY